MPSSTCYTICGATVNQAQNYLSIDAYGDGIDQTMPPWSCEFGRGYTGVPTTVVLQIALHEQNHGSRNLQACMWVVVQIRVCSGVFLPPAWLGRTYDAGSVPGLVRVELLGSPKGTMVLIVNYPRVPGHVQQSLATKLCLGNSLRLS